MSNRIKIFLLLFLFIASAFFAKAVVLADTATSTPATLSATQKEQADLQLQLQDLENQIAQYEQELKSVQGEKNTLQNKVNQLKKQQVTLNLKIKSTNLQIGQLNSQISQTQVAIGQNIAKTGRLKQQIGQQLQLINEQDNNPFLYLVLSNNSLSDVLSEMESYLQVSQSLDNMLQEAKQLNDELNQQQQTLSNQKDDAKNLLSIQNLQKQGLADSMNQQNDLLVQTKGKESNYQAVLSDKQKQAQVIRDRLYQLLEVANQINFGQAVEIAQWAGGHTGVRAAFLLAILTQESNLGKNVGTCNRSGDPVNKSWKVIMSPKDQSLFQQITQELSMDVNTTPVSCPMRDSRGRQVGWGGAMGPAQFIPSTWMGYRDQVAAITGKTANPWDIRDAFMAAAVKLAAGGATSQDGEWRAAMLYFSGSTNTRFRFYGDSVVAQAARYQADIDQMSN